MKPFYNSSELEHLQYQRNIAYNNGDMDRVLKIQERIDAFEPKTEL